MKNIKTSKHQIRLPMKNYSYRAISADIGNNTRVSYYVIYKNKIRETGIEINKGDKSTIYSLKTIPYKYRVILSQLIMTHTKTIWSKKQFIHEVK